MMEPTVEYIAGLLEGEGCFRAHRDTIRVTLGMCDEDTVQRFVDWFNRHFRPVARDGSRGGQEKPMQIGFVDRSHVPDHQSYFVAKCNGRRAALLMILLRPLMSIRKTAEIDNSLAIWEAKTFGATS